MSDGSDGAGGVGGSGGSSASDTSSSTDTGSLGGLEGAAKGLSDAVSSALGAATGGLAEALGGLTGALGLDGALSGLADALGLDDKAFADIAVAAALGMLTGGIPGAIAAVARGLASSVVGDAARDAVSSLPAAMQPLANMAIDKALGQVPGGLGSLNANLAALAEGALSSGRAPAAADFGALARSLSEFGNVAKDTFGSLAKGDPGGAAQAIADGVAGYVQGTGAVSQAFSGAMQNGQGGWFDAANHGFGGKAADAFSGVLNAAAGVIVRN